jgi:uncharacterized protein YgiM (DUF1202 family)
MKKIFLLIGILSFVFPINSFSQNLAKPKVACSISAYVIDKDANGLNVRSGAGKTFKTLGTLVFDEDGTTLEIKGATGSWLMIEGAETLGGETTFSGKGWVSASMLGISTARKAKLYSSASLKGKTLATIPGEEELTILGCMGEWVKVKYKSKQGWLAPDSQCGTPVTTCP